MANNTFIRKCGTDLNNKNLEELNGDRFRINALRTEQSWLNYRTKLSTLSIEQPVLTIPVVVHIVYNDESQNIPNSRVYSQIDVLNSDFRKKNSDRHKVPDVWKNISADSRIEFMLAKRDPTGNKTDAITRTKTNFNQFLYGNDVHGKPLPEKIKSTKDGGKDPWDTSRYLNIWVCNIAEQKVKEDGQLVIEEDLLGYAQFPNRGGPETDGVVINHVCFGINPDQNAFGLGRTTTHEVGHWLDLRHIWGDDFFSEDSDNPRACLKPDNIPDTPNQKGYNAGKPTFPSMEHACYNTGPNGTMFMNYMDYTHDDSMYMFTRGQCARMYHTLSTSRSTLLRSTALKCPVEESHLESFRKLPPKVFNGIDSFVEVEKIL
ncbi:M43 family zinc metalloprotease [Candidatus Nitrosocosmicus hydrocola]|uniref:M43 family zinc metalloprotease n=1 Tax=Candidatus Nitrosocosmicus hydrocola TaxID=1826872 RepID=UPI000B217493|nr:M43 family zinc metalloprotease [Candidatus Nitrosocosmicus hydrocola]